MCCSWMQPCSALHGRDGLLGGLRSPAVFADASRQRSQYASHRRWPRCLTRSPVSWGSELLGDGQAVCCRWLSGSTCPDLSSDGTRHGTAPPSWNLDSVRQVCPLRCQDSARATAAQRCVLSGTWSAVLPGSSHCSHAGDSSPASQPIEIHLPWSSQRPALPLRGSLHNGFGERCGYSVALGWSTCASVIHTVLVLLSMQCQIRLPAVISYCHCSTSVPSPGRRPNEPLSGCWRWSRRRGSWVILSQAVRVFVGAAAQICSHPLTAPLFA